jgi:hypothetical protein
MRLADVPVGEKSQYSICRCCHYVAKNSKFSYPKLGYGYEMYRCPKCHSKDFTRVDRLQSESTSEK